MRRVFRTTNIPGQNRQGQTRREAGTQSPRASGGGGRVAETQRAQASWTSTGQRAVGAQRCLDERPRGVVPPVRYVPRRGPGEARTPPKRGARGAGAPGAAKGPLGEGAYAGRGTRNAFGVYRAARVVGSPCLFSLPIRGMRSTEPPPTLLLSSIHRIAWKVNSANFACMVFSEVQTPHSPSPMP
jgi:hypothetical protein